MFVTSDQVLAHFIGDYILQSDWMASEKTKRNLAALAHAVCYAIPFLFLSPLDFTILVIVLSHYLIDHFKLARYVCWFKNFLSPEKTLQLDTYPAQYQQWWRPWKDCMVTGYPPERPVWLATWLMIITDNILHIIINAAAIKWL